MRIEELAIAKDKIRVEAHQQVIEFVDLPTTDSFERALEVAVDNFPITTEERGILRKDYFESFYNSRTLIRDKMREDNG